MEEIERTNDRITEQVVSLKYGFIPRGSYVHTTKHCNILSVTFNSKKSQYVILDSRGVSTWAKSNKYNYYNRLKDFDASEFNSLYCVSYNRAANLYFGLTRDYDIKIYNMNFIEVLLIDLEGTTVPKVVYDSKLNELVAISRKKVQFWKLSIVDSSRIGEGFRLQREFDVPSTSLITNAEYDDEFQFIYLISHNVVWCYDATDMKNFAQFTQSKLVCSSFKTCAYLKRTNIFATGTSNGEIPIYSYSGALIQTLRKHTRAITSLLPHPRDPFLFLSSSMDGCIKIFSLQIYDEIYSISVFPDGIKWMHFQSPLSLYCASLSTVSVFDINHICSFWSTVRCPVNNIDLYPKLAGRTSHIVVQDADKCIRIYNKRSGEKLCTVLPPPETFFESGMPSYSYDKIGKIIYILFKETDLWIYLTRTDPATRVNVWNIQNILESKVSDIKNAEQSNDLDDFGIGLFRKREAKEDVICLCTETIPRDVFQMNPLVDITQPTFDLLICGMSNGKVYFLDPSPPLTVKFGFAAHATCPVVDLKTVYDSLTSPVRILSLIKSSSNLCVKIWNAHDFSLLGKIDISPDVTVYAVKSTIFVCGNRHGYLRVEWLNEDENLYAEIDENESSICHHIGAIVSVDVLPSKRLICSCGKEDFYVRVWNFQKELIAEIRLDETLSYSSFLDSTGSLLVGFQSHLYSISRDILYLEEEIDEEDGKENDEIAEMSSGEESIVYEDPQMKKNYRRKVEFETKELDNYLIPYPYLSLESNWMYQCEIMDEADSPDVAMEDEKSRSCTPSSVYADTTIFSDTSCSSISDSEFAGVEMPRCGDSPECEEMHSFHKEEIPFDEQMAQESKEYVLPITTLHNKRSIRVTSTLSANRSTDGQLSSSTIDVRQKRTQTNLNKPNNKKKLSTGPQDGRSKSPRKSPMVMKTRKGPKKGKPTVGSESSENEEESDEEKDAEQIENVQSSGGAVCKNVSGDSVMKNPSGDSVAKMSSGETVFDSSSGENIVFMSSSDETVESFTSSEAFTEGSIPCYISEEGDAMSVSASKPIIPGITNTTPNGTTKTVEIKSQESGLLRQMPSIVIIAETPEMSSDPSSENVPQEQHVTKANVTINRTSSEESSVISSSSQGSSLVDNNASESSNAVKSTGSREQVLGHNVSSGSHSSFDIDHNEWQGSGFIKMTPSGRHYTQEEAMFIVRDEDGTYYNMRSEDSMRKNPASSKSAPIYPLNKVEVKLGAFSEHCTKCPSSCKDIGLHWKEQLKRKSTQDTIKSNSMSITDSEIVLKSISSHEKTSVKESNKINKNTTKKDSGAKNVIQSKLNLKKVPGATATRSRERCMLVNRVKRQSIQYSSQKDFMLNKSGLDEIENNEVSLVNDEINKDANGNSKGKGKTDNFHISNDRKKESKRNKQAADLNSIIESSESSELCEIERTISMVSQANEMSPEKNKEGHGSKSMKTSASNEEAIKSEESVVPDDVNDFLFEVNVTRPRQKHFPQLEPIDQTDLVKLNSIYTKQLRDTLRKTTRKLQDEHKKKKKAAQRKKKEEKEEQMTDGLMKLNEVEDDKNEEDIDTAESTEITEDEFCDVSVDVKIRGRGITKKMIPGSLYHEQRQPVNSHANSDDEETFFINREKSYRSKQRHKQKEKNSDRVLYKMADDDYAPDPHGHLQEQDCRKLSVDQSQKASKHLFRRSSADEETNQNRKNQEKNGRLDVSLNQKASKDFFTRIEGNAFVPRKEDSVILDGVNRNQVSGTYPAPRDSIEKLHIRGSGSKRDLRSAKKSDAFLSPNVVYDEEKDYNRDGGLRNTLSITSLQIPAQQLNEYDNTIDKDIISNGNNKVVYEKNEKKCPYHDDVDEVESSIKIVSISNKYYNHNIDSLTEEYLGINRVDTNANNRVPKEVPASALYEFCSLPPGKKSVSPALMNYYFKGKGRNSPVSFNSDSKLNNSPESLSPGEDNAYSKKMYLLKESRLSSGYGTHSPCSNNSEKSKKRLTIKSSPIFYGYSPDDDVSRSKSRSMCSEKFSVPLSKDERLAKAKKLESKLSGQSHRLSKRRNESELADDKVKYMFLKSTKEGREFLQSMRTRTVSIPKKKAFDI